MKCNNCSVNLSDDNGYGYIVDELKKTRDNIDDIIKKIEARKEKDTIINEVLNTDYENEKQESTAKTTQQDIINAYVLNKILNPRTTRAYPFYTNRYDWYWY